MYAKIIENRVRYIVETQLSKSQFGFRKGRGCTDAIFALRQLSEKTIEYGQELHLAFIDQEKAFDRVNRDKLWGILEDYGVRGELLDAVRALYRNSLCAVRTKSGLTDWFNITSGVRQGCVLSPLLFIVYMDRITKEANPNEYEINELLFAGDHCLIHDNQEDLQRHITSLNDACTKYDMKISIEKTETMVIRREPGEHEIFINSKKLSKVEQFKYLGSMFTEEGRISKEIEARIQKASNVNYQLTPILKHRNIPLETKKKIINAIFVPTLCYQSQTWALNKSQEQKIIACEMRCLRKAVNKTRRDRVRNEEIRNSINIKPVMHSIEKQRLKWFGHLVRMKHDEMPSRLYNQRHSGRRDRGRPRKRWIEGIRETAKKMNLTIKDVSHLALERIMPLPHYA